MKNTALDLKAIQVRIVKKEYLTDALKRYGFVALPSNAIINKRLPGLGATYCELTAPRHSIIIEPNVPVIVGKALKHTEAFGVYRGVTTKQILAYLKSDVPYKKILTTPESFGRVKEAAAKANVCLHSDYFMLIDECEKLVQDIHYRDSIALPIDDFFKFDQKALVSATPLYAVDKRFAHQGFRVVNVEPDYEYRKAVEVITTNNVAETYYELISELNKLRKGRGTVCVFINSIATIDSICYRDSSWGNDTATFCSREGFSKLIYKKDRNFYDTIEAEHIKRYNFFTSRFYSAVDIDLRTKPDVIVISNVRTLDEQSIIDPATEAVQIYGRFRNGVRSFTHIVSLKPDMQVSSGEEVCKEIHASEKLLSYWKERHEQAVNSGEKEMWLEAIAGTSFWDICNTDGELDPLKLANRMYKEQVKSLYTERGKLLAAYGEVPFFDVTNSHREFLIADDDRVIALSRGVREVMARDLLEKIDRLHDLMNRNPAKHKSLMHQIRSIIGSPWAELLYRCYLEKGLEWTLKCKGRMQQMERGLESSGSIARKGDVAICNRIYKLFEVGKEYEYGEVEKALKKVYAKNDLSTNRFLLINDLRRYFKLTSRSVRGKRFYRLDSKR